MKEELFDLLCEDYAALERLHDNKWLSEEQYNELTQRMLRTAIGYMLLGKDKEITE